MRKFILFALFACTAVMASAQDVDFDVDLDNDSDNEGCDIAVVLGYVSKQWSSDVKGKTIRENLWGEESKRLHGFQIGFTYTPTLPSGLGVYTGLMAEFYLSFSKAMGYDEFTEFSFYVPIHANFKLPVSKEVSLTAHGGLGLNYACHGGFTNRDDYYWVRKWDEVLGCTYWDKQHYEVDHLRYGKDGWPKRFNAALELVIGVKIQDFLISGGYSWGLTDHQFYKDVPGCSTRQDKLSFSVGYEF